MHIKRTALFSGDILVGSYPDYHNIFQSQRSDKDILESV